MIVTCEAIQNAEKRLFVRGIDAEPLMEEAGWQCARAIRQFCPDPGKAVLYVGKGHNGGDALVIGRHLRLWGWKVSAQLALSPGEELHELVARKLDEFAAVPEPPDGLTAATGPLVLVDGLLGIGAKGPLRGRTRELAVVLNAKRRRRHAMTFAVDLPTGIDGDSGIPCEGAVEADVTLSITAVKLGLVADAALDHVGRLVQIPMPVITSEITEGDASIVVPSPDWIASRLPRRTFASHKGTCGRVALLAGSMGLAGAAKLCGLGALRGGAGLVTVFVPESIYQIVAAAAPAEIMVRPSRNFEEVRDFPADVLALGPGLGADPEQAGNLLSLIQDDPRPVLIDADGLNLLSRQPGALASLSPRGPRLLTPHPGELARLLGGNLPAGKERLEIARGIVGAHPITLLFKGARTVIAEKGKPSILNATGHPAMATGGIGDVLTGLCAALIGQGLSLYDAAAAGSWLIGRAAEIALMDGSNSAESLLATDIARHLGAAFQAARTGGF
jgi:ADP-dependent NAD(P)H-hydrate dehydratase / NAD(P)H-hydrate epimerase